MASWNARTKTYQVTQNITSPLIGFLNFFCTAVAFSPDGKTLAVTEGGIVVNGVWVLKKTKNAGWTFANPEPVVPAIPVANSGFGSQVALTKGTKTLFATAPTYVCS